jgi:hypothetical protein
VSKGQHILRTTPHSLPISKHYRGRASPWSGALLFSSCCVLNGGGGLCSSFYRWDRVVPSISKNGNFHNRLMGSMGDLPTKTGGAGKTSRFGRIPSSAEFQVRPPSTAFHSVSGEFILRIFPRVSGSIEQTLTDMWSFNLCAFTG